jgi:hypothetical protein
MQTHNPNGTHCSLGPNEAQRHQCDTCHGIEQEKAQAEHKAYHGPYNKKLLPPPIDKDPLDEIAKICRSLTYGEMMVLGAMLYPEFEACKEINRANPMAQAIHEWSKNHGMDNNVSSSSSNNPDIDVAINDLYNSEVRAGGSS